MSDQADADRARLADRLAEAGLSSERFIDVTGTEESDKGTYDHTRYDADSVSGNYGVYAGDGVVILDVDDHSDGVDTAGLRAVVELPDTFTVKSPHTDGSPGGHRIYHVETEREVGEFDADAVLEGVGEKTKAAAKDDPVALALAEEFGKPNLAPTWGEVRATNQYTVGPGSQLTRCDKEWCDECREPDGGRYEIAADRPVASIDVTDLIEALREDPQYAEADTALDEYDGDSNAGEGRLSDDEKVERALEYDEKLARLWNGNASDYGGDRSKADSALAAKLAYWLGRPDKQAVARQMDRSHAEKWNERTDASYRESVLEAVDVQSEYADWSSTGRESRPASSDDGMSPRELWEWWADARTAGDLDESSIIPERALWHVAREHTSYDFEALEAEADEVDELPAKAHNKALSWLNHEWTREVGIVDPDAELEFYDRPASARPYKSRSDAVYTWEDVRYVYDDDKERGRQAAEDLLRERHHFMTVDDTDELHIYDAEKGIYTPRLAELYGDIHAGLGAHWSTHELNEITARLRQQNRVESRHLNERQRFDEPHIVVGNGVLNLYTGELEPHSPEYVFVDRIPWDWKGDDADTAPFEAFVDDLVRREEDKRALFEMVGHALVPDANERYKLFLMLHGSADNGKSMFFRWVSHLLEGDGEERNVSNVKLEKLTSNRFSAHAIYGRMANIAGEIDGKKIRNTAHLKDITGGDQVELEPKGTESFFDTINATLMFAANDPPILGERDKQAIATRLVPIELPYEFVDEPDGPMQKERVPERVLEERLTTPVAMSGFLKLAVDGVQRLEENHGDVSLPESPRERLENYERQADPMKEFGMECLENHESDYVVKADVTALYARFAQENGYELGTNYSDQLHKVLRGIESLDYTTSRPREPDYSDTSLPLRPWNERKRVLDRVTLTDEGLEYAKAEGLVVDESDESADEGDEALPEIADLEPAASTTIVAQAVSVIEPRPWLQAEGTLRDASGVIDYVARGETNPAAEVEQGGWYRFEGVKVRTNDDGLLEVELRDGLTTVEAVTNPTAQTGLEAAADGGATLTDREQDASDEGDESPESDDPDPPAGPHDDAQCRECGTYWNATPDDPRETCKSCGAPVDWEWNVDTGRVPPEKAPLANSDESAARATTPLPPADAVGSKPDAHRLCRTLEEHGGQLTKSDLFGKAATTYDVAPDRADAALDYARENGLVGVDGERVNRL